MRTCRHPPLEDFDVRGVARLCAPCLLSLHELAVGPPESALHTGGRFRTVEARELALARVVGCVDPTPDTARTIAVAAALVAECDDRLESVESALALWLDHGSTHHADLDQLLDRVASVADLLDAVDVVTEIADA